MDIEEFKSRYTQHDMTKAEIFGQDVKDILNDDTLIGELISRAVSGMAEAIADKMGEALQSFAEAEAGSPQPTAQDILQDPAFQEEVVRHAYESFKEQVGEQFKERGQINAEPPPPHKQLSDDREL